MSELFNIIKGDIISITGAGGKTSLMFYLANQLKKRGTVLIATTTKILNQRAQKIIVLFSYILRR